jgi:hypothetical protein
MKLGRMREREKNDVGAAWSYQQNENRGKERKRRV